MHASHQAGPASWPELCPGLQAPIIQAPMAGAQDHRLALAVGKGGGLGSVPAAMLSPEALHAELTALSAASDAPFNVNFFLSPQPSARP